MQPMTIFFNNKMYIVFMKKVVYLLVTQSQLPVGSWIVAMHSGVFAITIFTGWLVVLLKMRQMLLFECNFPLFT